MTDSTEARAAAEKIAAALASAWNAADAKAYAAEFTGDADFVNIFGMHGAGRHAIMQAHQTIFDTIYKGSASVFAVEAVRPLGDRAAVAHLHARVNVPSGPLAGELVTRATAVLVREGDDWQIVAFQNTREQKPPISIPGLATQP